MQHIFIVRSEVSIDEYTYCKVFGWIQGDDIIAVDCKRLTARAWKTELVGMNVNNFIYKVFISLRWKESLAIVL